MTHYFVIKMAYEKPEPHHRLCFQSSLVSLQQRSHYNNQSSFLVRYGREIHSGLTYSEACTKLGSALMHQTACDGLLVSAA